VIVTSFVAAVCGDQLFFHLGRRHAKGLLERFPRLRDKVNVALRKIEDHQVKIALSMRFLWGLRIATPVALGLTTMDARRFLWLNLLSAAVWSTVISLVGFGTGHVISQYFTNLHGSEKWFALALAAVAALVLWMRWHGARLARTGGDASG
jgi:membrane protein DedA with SNARE-associated domain